MSYQETTGTLSPGAHAGSYNGQDAYNDMLVTEDVLRISSDRSVQGVGCCIGFEDEGLQGRNRLSDRGGGDMDEPVMMSDRKGNNGVSENGTATTLTAQEKDRPLVASMADDEERDWWGDPSKSEEEMRDPNYGNGARFGASVVRRLTPLECTRLQNFPDGWLDIGDWTDEEGRTHKDANSPKYKAAGNSVALPFWEWLDKRISAEYLGTCTLGSLFDGISGFPLVHAKHNGPKSCRWSSEVEPFCVAVARKHFGDDATGSKGDIAEYWSEM